MAHARIDIMSSFLEGAFAPLAFLWLVIGYFLQKKELIQNTNAIKMQYIEIQKTAAQAEIQSHAMMQLISVHARSYSYKLFYGTQIRTKHSTSFIFNFERLIRSVEDCDDDGMIRDSLLGSGHGFIYERMITYKENPPPGFTYGNFDFDPDATDD